MSHEKQYPNGLVFIKQQTEYQTDTEIYDGGQNVKVLIKAGISK